LLGVGGGFVIVPALKKTTNLDLHSIVATSLMIIFLVGGLSIGLHVVEGFVYPTTVTVVFAGLMFDRIIAGATSCNTYLNSLCAANFCNYGHTSGCTNAV
jgi:uncharacterized membrane protein YfcA